MHKPVFMRPRAAVLSVGLAALLAGFNAPAAAADMLRCLPGSVHGQQASPATGATSEAENAILLEVDAVNKSVRVQQGPWSGPPLVVQSWTDQSIQVYQRQNRQVQNRFVLQQTLIFQIDRTTGLFKMTPAFADAAGKPLSRDDVLRELKEYGIQPQYAGLPLQPVSALCTPVQKVF